MTSRVTALLASVAFLGCAAQASAATLSFSGVQTPGTGLPVSVTGSDGIVFSFTAGPGSQFESFQSGFPGSFSFGTPVLSEGLGQTDPITISFSAPLTSIALPVASDRVGNSPYTATVSFYNGGSVVDTITKMGNAMNPAELFSFEGAVTSAIVSTSVAAADAPYGYTQNLGSFSYNVPSVPLPASAPMFGAALIALGAVGYGMKRRVLAPSQA